MAITINGSTGISGVDGSAATPAIIGSNAGTGLVFAAGQVSASLAGTSANIALVNGTAQNSTSGTSIDFTGIPSWVKRITVMFNGVSTSGTSPILLRLGTSSGIDSTASTYLGTGADLGVSTVFYSTGFALSPAVSATDIWYGQWILTLINPLNNIWIESHTLGRSASTTQVGFGAGSKTLSGTLDRVRITTVNGTDTFDAGSINIMYE